MDKVHQLETHSLRRRTLCSSQADARCPRRMAGISLLETLLLLFVLGGALVAGSVLLQNRTSNQLAAQQSNALQQANAQLRGFAAAHYRLPCPAFADTDGVEDCSRTQNSLPAAKGLLPWRTLSLEAAEARGNLARLGYLVYRSSSVDLASARNTFEPSDWNGNFRDYQQISSQDFCQALTLAKTESASSSARIVAADDTSSSIAYALAHAGTRDADGDGNPFDGRNANALPEMESPERNRQTSNYDDHVLTASFNDLSQIAACTHLIASLNQLALGVDVIHEVNAQKEATKTDALWLALGNAGKIVVIGIKSVGIAGVLAAATAALSAATAALSAAIGSCVVLIGCAEIPHAAASVAAAAVAVGAAAAAIAANVAAATALTVAIGLASAVHVQAGIEVTNSTIDLEDARNQACAVSDETATKKTEALAVLTNAEADELTARDKRGTAWGNMFDQAHSIVAAANQAGDPQTHEPINKFDHRLKTLKGIVVEWLNKEYEKAKKWEELKRAEEMPASSGESEYNQDLIDQLTAQINKEKAEDSPDPDKIAALEKALQNIQDRIAEASDTASQINSLQNQINTLQAQIDAETDEVRKAELQGQQASLQNQLAMLDTGVAGKQAAYDLAVTEAAAAKTAYETEKAAVVALFEIPYTTKDEYGEPVHHTYDGSAAISKKIDDYVKELKEWMSKEEAVRQARINHEQTESTYIQARDSCEKLTDHIAEGSSLPLITNWQGTDAETILQSADGKGGVQ